MKQYHDLLKDILINGEDRPDRTGTGTRSIFGAQMQFNLKEYFPAITTKKLAFNACKAELLWFLSGSTDERELCRLTHGTDDSSKRTIWTDNANATYWKSKAKFSGDLGKIYSYVWRNFDGVDQIAELVKSIKTEPYSRRHIISAWNPSVLPEAALPPCHVMSQYYVSTKGELSCHMYQRSADVFLGIPFNIASYALLTHMLAQVSGLNVGKLVISIGDAHCYSNHIQAVEEQLSRNHLDHPTLWLNNEVDNIFQFKMRDIQLENYSHHPPIIAPMAV